MNSIENISLNEIFIYALDMLEGRHTPLSSFSKLSEEPETSIISILTNKDLSPEKRNQIIQALKKSVLDLKNTIQSKLYNSDIFKIKIIRLCNVIDLASPVELKDDIFDLARVMFQQEDVKIFPITDIARACSVFAVQNERNDIWNIFTTIEETAAYGFNSLLIVDPDSVYLDNCLNNIKNNKWNIDINFMSRRMHRVRQKSLTELTRKRENI